MIIDMIEIEFGRWSVFTFACNQRYPRANHVRFSQVSTVEWLACSGFMLIRGSPTKQSSDTQRYELTSNRYMMSKMMKALREYIEV